MTWIKHFMLSGFIKIWLLNEFDKLYWTINIIVSPSFL